MTGPLIHPDRAKELRRGAAHHAAMIILTALKAGFDPDHYFPDDAERDLVLEEIERIGEEIKARAIVGTHQRCSVCGFPYKVITGGVLGRHYGVTLAGFSSGVRCDGVHKPPRRSES